MPEAIDFPTLGFLAADWVEQHCCVPDGFALGSPLVHDGWQLICDLHHYRVKPSIEFNPVRPLQGQAFHYRRSIVVGGQKLGKSPWRASLDLFEAVGPCLFGGWAAGGEVYRCADGGCGCGWEYHYEPGEPMGLCRPKSLIQIMATADDQVDNVYLPMQTMVRMGPLAELIRVNEWGLRLPNNGKLEPVTSKATTRLGAPINYAGADESGLFTDRNGVRKTWDTMRRGLGGMDGRSVETTNPWDPMENSSAQRAFAAKLPDVFIHYRTPPVTAKQFRTSKRSRRQAYEAGYADSPWVNIDSIEAVAEELVADGDWVQAARFYGSLLVQGLGTFMDESIWDAALDAGRDYPDPRTPICLGMDGSRNNDWTAIRAETVDGYRFTPTYEVGGERRPTIWNPQLHEGEIPRQEVRSAVEQIFKWFRVERFYIDPKFWETQADAWALEYGEETVIQWPTNSTSRIDPALRRYLQDLKDNATTHDGCEYARQHALNARKVAKPGEKFTLGKPSEHQKIDVAMSDVLTHEAASDARAAGWEPEPKRRAVFFR